MRIGRRELLAAGLGAATARSAQGDDPPLAAFDREIQAFMEPRKIPGAALAVVRGRRLVYARGYGWADREARVPVTPDSLFRLASISKPITGLAVMKLVEQGRLRLEDPAFAVLDRRPDLAPVLERGERPDPRLERITIRQLLDHTGGWDREKSFDPMFRSRQIARALGVEPPASAAAVIRYMRGRKLDFDPGARYAYSNFGYAVLGRIVETVTGRSYGDWVRDEVLRPMGIRSMVLGRTLARDRAPGEVRYSVPGDPEGRSVFPGQPERVPVPYGTFYLEAMDAHGGWLASATDLARLAAALADPTSCPVLRPGTLETMTAPPPAPVSRKPDGSLADWWYAGGWSVRPRGGGRNYWHAGSLPGTYTLLVRRFDGLSWAVLFNQRSTDRDLPDREIDPALHRAANAVRDWPEGRPLPEG